MCDNDKVIQLLDSRYGVGLRNETWQIKSQYFLQQQGRLEQTSVKLILKYKNNELIDVQKVFHFVQVSVC